MAYSKKGVGDTSPRKKRKPRAKPKPVSPYDVDWAISEYLEVDVCDVHTGGLPIDDVKAMRLHFLEMARECAEYAKGSRYPDDKAQARIYRSAVWRCQVEINRHNAFMKRQLRLPL